MPQSSVQDSDTYYVRNNEHSASTAELLARVKQKLRSVMAEMQRQMRAGMLDVELSRGVGRMLQRHNNGQRIELHELNPGIIEHLAINNDKGASIFVCTAGGSPLSGPLDQPGDENVVMFIALHEIAHSMTDQVDPAGHGGVTQHSDAFFKQEQYAMKVAVSMGLLKPPATLLGQPHCGTELRHPKQDSLF